MKRVDLEAVKAREKAANDPDGHAWLVDEGPDQCDVTLDERIKQIVETDYPALIAELEILREVEKAAIGFKDHGVAKNGTHAAILFEALAALKSQGETEA